MGGKNRLIYSCDPNRSSASNKSSAWKIEKKPNKSSASNKSSGPQ